MKFFDYFTIIFFLGISAFYIFFQNQCADNAFILGIVWAGFFSFFSIGERRGKKKTMEKFGLF